MSDLDKLHRANARATRAQQLLDDELFAEALTGLERAYIEGWKAAAARDTDARERFWQAVQIVGKIKGHFETIIRDGKVAKKDLEDIATMGERRKRFGIV